MCARPPFSIVPQLGVGGCTPSPRKLSDASPMIAPAMPSVACTTTAGTARRNHVPPEDARRRRAERARRLDVLELARAQHLPADQPRIADPPNQRERQQHVDQARPEHRDKRDGEQQSRKREQRCR